MCGYYSNKYGNAVFRISIGLEDTCGKFMKLPCTHSLLSECYKIIELMLTNAN